MSSLYIFTTQEQAKNINRNYEVFNFNFAPLSCASEKFYIKLDENNIQIYDKYMNLLYNGSLNLELSKFSPRRELKLIYDLEDGVNFIGGNFVLEKDIGILIHNGSGLKFLAAYKGSVKKVKNAYE